MSCLMLTFGRFPQRAASTRSLQAASTTTTVTRTPVGQMRTLCSAAPPGSLPNPNSSCFSSFVLGTVAHRG